MSTSGVETRGFRVLFAVMLVIGLWSAAALPAMAQTTASWENQDWKIQQTGTGTVEIDSNGYAILTRTSGTGDLTLHINRILPTYGEGISHVNQYGTPWIEVTWEDNGEWRGVDVFVDDEGHPQNPRMQFGSLFECEGIAYIKYGASNEETSVRHNCGTGQTGTRQAGDIHTMYIGKRADGTLDFRFDGVWYTSTYLRDAGIPDFEFGDIHLRLRGTDGDTAVFRSFEYGDDHAGADAAVGGLIQISGTIPVNGTSSTADTIHRTLTATAVMVYRLHENDLDGLACLQLSVYDLQVRAQESRRRLSPANAALLYEAVNDVREEIGCGGAR